MTTSLTYNDEFLLAAKGFVNEGNDCYFNSICQALLACTPFVESIRNYDINNTSQFLSIKEVIDNRVIYDSIELTIKIIEIFKNLTEQIGRYTHTNTYNGEYERIKEDLKYTVYNGFKLGYSQHDATELLGKILDLFHEYATGIFIAFFIRAKKEKICGRCNHNSTVTDLSWFISLPIDVKNIEEYIACSIDKINDYRCEYSAGCIYESAKNNLTTLINKTTSTRLGPIICLTYNNFYDKIVIDYPPYEMCFNTNNNKKLLYKLTSIIYHYGDQGSGHYTMTRIMNNEMIYINDSKVEKIKNIYEIESKFIYILMYVYHGNVDKNYIPKNSL